jgi:hypothetical protein
MADMWICADCRSANEAKAKRCYRCGVPRAQGELTEATAAAAAASAQATRTVLATATRLGARYRPTWPLAIVASILIFATTGLIVVQARSDIARVTSDGRLIEDPGTAQAGLSMDAVVVIAFLAGVLVWSIWIALVVANVPALTARWPTRSPTGAFFAQWIPIINLKRPFTVVRDVVIILSGGAAGPALVVILWWIAFLARYVVPSSTSSSGSSETMIQRRGTPCGRGARSRSTCRSSPPASRHASSSPSSTTRTWR